MDAYCHGERFLVHFDLPGVDPSNIDLTVEENVLTVRAERNWQPGQGDEVVVSERPQGASRASSFWVRASTRNGSRPTTTTAC
jgi:HSP20 family protein